MKRFGRRCLILRTFEPKLALLFLLMRYIVCSKRSRCDSSRMTCKASLTPELETLDYRAEKWMHTFVAAVLLFWTSAILADGQTQTTKPAQAKAASAEPKPDLQVALPIPMNGTITVKNIGTARAAP